MTSSLSLLFPTDMQPPVGLCAGTVRGKVKDMLCFNGISNSARVMQDRWAKWELDYFVTKTGILKWSNGVHNITDSDLSNDAGRCSDFVTSNYTIINE